jgi:hypothetical protein
MDIEQITKLIDAGYTKADIDKMQAGEQGGNEPDESAGKETKTETKTETSAAPENENKVSDIDATIKALTETVSGLTETVKAIQEANLAGAQTKNNENKTVNDVMKSFIDTL